MCTSTWTSLFSDLAFWNLLAVTTTLVVLIWYTWETRRIRIQSQLTNLRPVILRSGDKPKWSSIIFLMQSKGDDKSALNGASQLFFSIEKNIATNIRGSVIIDGFEHQLVFFTDITTASLDTLLQISWGWRNSSSVLIAFVLSDKIPTGSPNRIVIEYCDIEGNNYYTVEDDNYVQRAGVGVFKP